LLRPVLQLLDPVKLIPIYLAWAGRLILTDDPEPAP
jgi:hypothetical protein